MPSRHLPSLALLVSVALSGAATSLAHAQQPAELPPPVAPKRPHTTNIHGRTLSDDYFWLRQKGDSGVLAHLRAESTYTAAVMKPTEALQKKIYDEMLARIKQTDVSAPYREGRYLYYSRTIEGKQYPVYVRSTGDSTTETVLLPPKACCGVVSTSVVLPS